MHNQLGMSHMEHFAIILALCRAAMNNPTPALVQHLKRLHAALQQAGAAGQAESIGKLLRAHESTASLEPSRVVLSRTSLVGEVMTPSVQPPVDKETGVPLATISWPHDLDGDSQFPILNGPLKRAVDALNEEWLAVGRLKEAGIRPPLNCMLFGVPGTGKTRLAQSMAAQLGIPLVTAKLDGLVSSFLGTTARNISMLFAFANRYQCILLLDEFDAVAKMRDDPHEVGEIKRVVNTLLQCLDARSAIGFTIALTNHEGLLDPAVWRRFDVRIHVPTPDAESREAIVARYMHPLGITSGEKRFLAWLTKDLTGADIKSLCESLRRSAAIRGAENFDFIDALRLQIQLSADHEAHERRAIFLSGVNELAKALAADPELGFTQEQLAQLFKKDQSTISRSLRKAKPHRS
jgi:hypothetical protein